VVGAGREKDVTQILATILDGRAVAEKLKEEMRGRVAALVSRGVTPTLALVRVGDDPASAVYVRGKVKMCKTVGIASRNLHLSADTTQDELLGHVRALNEDPAVHGMLVQLPLPAHLAEEDVLLAIDPEKDVDGFHPYNMGLFTLGVPRFVPGTPQGILEILKHYEINPAGQRVVVLGRSRIVGRPLANLLSAKAPMGNATVTICHTRTRNLAEVTRTAEILVVAAGAKRCVTADMVSPGAVVIDVGIHREPDPARPGKTRLCGDTDFAALREKVRAITPVPGGVGPMTIAAVLRNTVLAAERCGGSV
jgi:methylenetetrahydrofolate dehydrogenase (NADP+)/methenyltetrahydrofolate cyclohydrolase